MSQFQFTAVLADDGFFGGNLDLGTTLALSPG